ncbi:MAG TPA: PAS-domain containing protein [Azospirillaceae bacterium]|nr:PAS-domain containing protein [Azospirillaceae bacterium]
MDVPVVDDVGAGVAERIDRQLRETLRGYSDAIAVFGPDDRVIFTNARYHELFPHSPPPGEILGWSYEDLLRRSVATGQVGVALALNDPEAYVAQRMAERARLRGRTLRELPIGDRWYRAAEESIADGGIVIAYSDITDRRAAEDALKAAKAMTERTNAILRSAMEAIPGGFMVMDEQFNFLIWSSGWPEIGGASEEIVRAHPNMRSLALWQARRGDYDHIRIDPVKFAPEVIEATPCLKRLIELQAARGPGDPISEEERVAMVEWVMLRYRPEGRPDGERAESSGTVRVGGRGGRVIEFRRNRVPGLGWVSIYNDVTEQRRQAEATARARAEAEEALAELRATQESLVEAERLASLGGLVAGVAHELNTPVGIGYTAASFLSDRLRDFRAQVESGQVRRSDLTEFLDLVEETANLLTVNTGRASRLVQSFKNVAVDQTSDERRRFELRGYLEEIALSVGPQWKRPGHALEIDCPAGIEMDGYPGALSQVVANLIVNATVHAYPDGRAGRLSLSVARAGPDRVELVFADDGDGIAPEHLPRIFDPFFTTRRGTGSTGLGLNIVYNLVTGTLGGRVEVRSAPGAGTRFVLRLPLTAPQAAAEAAPA